MSTRRLLRSIRFFFRTTTTSEPVQPAIAMSSVSIGEGPSPLSPSIVIALPLCAAPLKTRPRACHDAETCLAGDAATSVGPAGRQADEEAAAAQAVERVVFDQPVDVALERHLEAHDDGGPDAG